METRLHPHVDLVAQCRCGAISLTLKGRVRAMLLCSCIDCQKATGTGHSTVAMFAADDVAVTGRPRSFAREADSGATFTRSFCPVCGTPLFGQSSRAQTMLMLPVGLLAGSNDWFAPNQLIFARSHTEWDMIAGELPRHQTYRDNGAP